MIRVYRPDLVTVARQRELRDCAMASIEMLLRYLERIDDRPVSLPSYEEIHREFRGSAVAHSTNIRKYVSGETVVDFFRRRVQPLVGRELRQLTASGFDDLVSAVAKSRLPVLVSYMTEVAHPAWAIPANLFLTAANLISFGHAGDWATDGELYVLNDYLHCSVVLAIVRVPAGRYVLVADPWVEFFSSEARGLIWIAESDFTQAWLGYDQRGLRLPWVDSYYKQVVEKEFDRLGGPGGMLVLS